mmetsp:Transcript_23183/g.56398  ORF Transcript_23183/g.56398 Transcript_23183/m.56398 type:complete len:242 (-) Transcript_23183:30-755(-)
MLGLMLQEVDLLLALALIDGSALSLTPLEGLALVLQLHDARLANLLLGLQIRDHVLGQAFALFCLELLPGSEGHRALVQRLIRCDGHSDLVAHAQQEQTSLRAVQGHLSDQLVKALAVELLAHRANARLACLALHQALVQRFLELNHIQARSLGVGDILDAMLPILNPLSRRQHRVQNVVCAGLLLHGRQLHLLHHLLRPRHTLCVLRPPELQRRIILYQGVTRSAFRDSRHGCATPGEAP